MEQVKTIKKTDAPADDETSVTSKEIVSSRNAVVKQTADIDGFIAKRQEFIQKVSAICVEGKDFHVIQGKKSLAKGGAEKIASIFQWNASFEKDNESLEMLGEMKGLVAFKCTISKGNKFVGEGRGAATLAKNNGDPNKTLKMAQKSAFIDAVLRSSGLSDFFTQDLEDMKLDAIDRGYDFPKNEKMPNTDIEPSERQINLIKDLMVQKNLTEAEIMDAGFDLKHLTGGKGGTASELIEHLMNYKKTFQSTTSDEAFNRFCKDLDNCTTAEEYEQISSAIKIAKKEGHLTQIDFDSLKKVCADTVKKITGK